MNPPTGTPTSSSSGATQLAVPAWLIPLLVIAGFALLVLAVWVPLCRAPSPQRSYLPSNNFEMTSSQLVEPPPAYDPSSPPPYPGPKHHRPHTTQSSCADFGASSSSHNS
ncbi:hypothetical protein PISMIDRAFT_15926 [Pisolithus microcarpus 441]|uniref:Uncharacterized protein n=1 Tax=Pisolithus microcarpus 441 TaxID=765257 RepID=A0A0C9XV36_9AGAM|nr:hypothetical protein BKA83DRAFT_15926 [Pisolithus microcarpus]KIK16295.1 hypothetical protein PISMIDRAFT_15926 [Pisolithus microcarpus 441]